jgi:hypothetical protein
MRQIAYIAQLGRQWVGKGDGGVLATSKYYRIMGFEEANEEGWAAAAITN